MSKNLSTLSAAVAVGLVTASLQASPLNGVSDYGTDEYGYYYAIAGGKFPTGATPNGDNGSGGTFRFLIDDATVWGRNPAESGVWQKDDWFTDTAGMAVTLRDGGGAIVYDNNGLEADAASPADPTFYNVVTGNYPVGGHGAHTMYSMSNNFDWIYAGYMKIETPTTVKQLTGYFNYSSNPSDALTAGFDPNDPNIEYRMNIWSNVSGDLLPADTDSFDGDIFASDASAGTFSLADTGFNRVGSSTNNDILALTYTLSSPIVLQPGEYWFSHDASIVPEPTGLGLIGIGAAALLGRRRRQSSK